MRVLLSFLLFLFFVSSGIAQSTNEDSDGHHDHKNDLGMANSAVYFLNHDEVTYGIHLHYVRNITNSRVGFGVGYERIFDEHQHQTISAVGQFYPLEKLVFTVSPGVIFEENDFSTSAFALHLESTYGFEIGDFHIGPLVEFAWDPRDIHISLGLHTGIGF